MKKVPKYLFGDIVVIDENNIGVILKTWGTIHLVMKYIIVLRVP